MVVEEMVLCPTSRGAMAIVSTDGSDVCMELYIQEMERVGEDEQRQEGACVVEDVLHWVHG
jgi:hypothetical protein